jgi:magnesium transporter
MNKIEKIFRKPPGTIVYTGNSSLSTNITHYVYGENSLSTNDDLYNLSEDMTDWISVEGFNDINQIKEFCVNLGIDHLTIEDIFNVTQRNKFEVLDDHLFAVLKYISLENDVQTFKYISFIIKKDCIITFSDYTNPFVKEILERIKNDKALISKYYEDYLFYAIYDIIVDDQMEYLKHISDRLNEYESKVLDVNSSTGNKIYKMHRDLVILRNNIISLEENMAPEKLLETEYISDEISKYFTDLEDHLHNLYEKSNTLIEVCNSLIMLYSNQLSNRTNEIMKTLTIMSVIFIPLSFLAGVFGMNFTNFAILQDRYGLLIFGIISVIIPIVMLLYFKHKKWL